MDTDAFEQIVRGTETLDALLEEADRLYQGNYVPDNVAEEWTGPRREELRNLWTELQLDLARSRERRGDVEGAAAALQKVLAKDGCDERAARELMLLGPRRRCESTGSTSSLWRRCAASLMAPRPRTRRGRSTARSSRAT